MLFKRKKRAQKDKPAPSLGFTSEEIWALRRAIAEQNARKETRRQGTELGS